jgi:hypothetical protein
MDAATAAYLTERDKAIAELKDSRLSDSVLEQRNKVALQRLQGMMQGIVGPIHLEGFPTRGTYNVETLVQELGFGALDGLTATSLDGKTTAVVTTVPLLQLWLRQNPNLLKHPAKPGTTDFAEAFELGDFFDGAVPHDDAHYYTYAALPVTQGHGLARAILFVSAQDDPAPAPVEGVLVAVMKGDQVVMFRKSLAGPTIPECSAAFAIDSKKALALEKAEQAAKTTQKTPVPSVDHYEQASNAFIHCYAQHLPGTTAYAALVREAQALVDKVP